MYRGHMISGKASNGVKNITTSIYAPPSNLVQHCKPHPTPPPVAKQQLLLCMILDLTSSTPRIHTENGKASALHMPWELDRYWAWCNASCLPIDPNMPLCIHFIYVDSGRKSNHVSKHAPLLSRVTKKRIRHVAYLDSCRRTYRSHTIWHSGKASNKIKCTHISTCSSRLQTWLTYYACLDSCRRTYRSHTFWQKHPTR